jgi:hypothetical protein
LAADPPAKNGFTMEAKAWLRKPDQSQFSIRREANTFSSAALLEARLNAWSVTISQFAQEQNE